MNLESNITNITSTPLAARPSVAPTSPAPVAASRPPVAVAKSEKPEAAQRREEFTADAEQVAAKLAEAAGSRTDLQFRVDNSLGRVIVSVVDAKSGEVIRQMPSEEALRIARNLAEDGTGLLSDVA